MKIFGLMFHHFHDGIKHKRTEGSITKSQLKKILLNFKKSILTPEEFMNSISEKKSNQKKIVCLTFDDSIKSQIDVALEVLDDLNLKSFFFSNSFQFDHKIGMIECCRFFRNNYFNNINEFYDFFFKNLKKKLPEKKIKNFINSKDSFFKKWKKISPFYSNQDLEFRLIRDFFLKQIEYNEILIELFKLKKFDYKKATKSLHFTKKDLKKLSCNNHEIGLHSHTHPIPITKLSSKNIEKEYKKNLIILKGITNKSINSMSHPNGYFNNDCKKTLNKLGIKIGFANSYKNLKKQFNLLNIPRIDHTELI